ARDPVVAGPLPGDVGAEGPDRRERAQAVLGLEAAVDFRHALRERAEERGAVGDRLVPRHLRGPSEPVHRMDPEPHRSASRAALIRASAVRSSAAELCAMVRSSSAKAYRNASKLAASAANLDAFRQAL